MPKPAKNEPRYRSPTHGLEDEFQRVSTSSGMSDHEDADSPPLTLGKDKEENAFIGFLGELSTIEFDLPMSYPPGILLILVVSMKRLKSSGTVCPCSSLTSIINSNTLQCSFLFQMRIPEWTSFSRRLERGYSPAMSHKRNLCRFRQVIVSNDRLR